MDDARDAPEAGEFLTVKQVARHIGVAPMTIYRMLHTGQIPYSRIGKLMRIRRTDWEALLAEAQKRGSDAS